MEKTLVQDESSIDNDVEIAICQCEKHEDCPYIGELEGWRQYCEDPIHYIFRGEGRYLEDWLDLQDAVVAWLVENN